jgi:uncharacterized repeat protein (TIGR01451 family)
VPLAGGASLVTRASTSTLNDGAPFSGKVSARRPCRDSRKVEVHDASDDDIVARATTGPDGRWMKSKTFTGQAYAKVLRKTISPFGGDIDRDNKVKCKADRSPVVSFGGAADLSVDKVFDSFAQAGAHFTVTISNLGPNDAEGVVLTDVPQNGTLVGASGATCSQSGGPGSSVTCQLGEIGSGGNVVIGLTFSGMFCNGSTNTATVSSSSDPSAENNSDNALAFDPDACGIIP